MTDRASAQVKGAETPDPTGDGAGSRQGCPVGTLCQRHPVESRPLRGSRYVVCPGTGERLSHVASPEDVQMPTCGQEGGGSVGASCQDGMCWTR